MKRVAYVSLLCTLVVACTSITPGPEEEDTDPPPPPPPPVVVDAEGTFDLVSPVSITTSALTPEMVYQYYDLLRTFREDPATALFTVLSDAGVPLVDELMAALPSALEDRLKGWINAYVEAKLLAGPLGEGIDTIIAYGELTVTQVELVTELEIPAAGDGRHRLLALRFHVGGEDLDVPVPTDAPAPFALDVPVEIQVTETSLALGDHVFGVEVGRLVWIALDQAIRHRYGDGVRGLLGGLVDCPALAQSVANHCVLGVCVGHTEELETICEAGLDELVNQMQQRVEEVSFDAVHLASGHAQLQATDGVVERIEGGIWECSIDLGQGPRSVPAGFSGRRQ